MSSSIFSYAAVNDKTGVKVSPGTDAVVSFDFRDFKYISNVEKFQTVISNPRVIAGLEEDSVTIDFTKMTTSDKAKRSLFEVAGRMYFEASVFGAGIVSFSTNGFFDREGYQEPVNPSVKRWEILKIVLPILGVLFLIMMYVCCSKFYKAKQMREEEEKLKKLRYREAERQRFLRIEREQAKQRKEKDHSSPNDQ